MVQAAAINAPPQILAQPQNQVVVPGESASFSVMVADTRALSYQWRFNGADITAATGEALLLQNVGSKHEGQYTVVLTNPSGSVTSAPAVLMIDADADGLADSWEQTYFGSLAQYPAGDSDGDGVSNGTEFLDGTDPTNSASAIFRLTLLSDGGQVIVTPSRFRFTNGESVTLTATAFAPHAFHGWGGDIDEASNPITLTITNNTTIFAYLSSYDIRWRFGVNGDWHNRTNWSPKFVPASNDNVFITETLRVTNNNDVVCRSLTLGAAGNAPFLFGSGSLRVLERCDWLGGTFAGTGRTVIEAGAALTASGFLTLASGTLENGGTTLWTSGNLRLNSATISNRAGAIFEARGSGGLLADGGSPRIDNVGTFRKSVNNGTTTVSANFNNFGVVEIQTGTLDLASGTNGGMFDVAAGATLSLGGTYSAAIGSSITGAGNFTVRGGTATLSGLVNLNGTNSFIGGTANLNGNYVCTNNPVTISGGTVNFNGRSTVAALNLSSGSTLAGSSVLTVLTEMNWSGGTMSGSGRTVIPSGAALNINPPSVVFLSRTLENAGTILWTAGNISPGGAVITNRAGGVFEAQTATTLSVGGVNRFDNAGIFRKSVSAGTATWPMAFNNYGAVEVETGTLRLQAAGTHSGVFNIAAGASLNLSGGTHAADAGSIITGAGDFLVSGGTATLAGLVNPSGAHVFSSGTANLNGTYICTNNPVTISGATVNFNGTSTVATVNLSSGTLGGTAVLNVMDTMNWSGGTMSGSGRTVIPPGASLNLTAGSFATLNTRTLENGGTAIWTGAGILNMNFAVITNRAGALFELRNNAPFVLQAGSCRFDNAGTLRKAIATGTSTFTGVSFNNYGATEIQTGTLLFRAACTNHGAFALSSGTVLRFAGGGLSSGTITAPATALVEWTTSPFTLNSGAQLNGAGLYRLSGTTLTFNTDTAVENLDVLGTLNGGGSVTVNNLMNWTSGTMTGSGRTRIAPTATLNLNNSVLLVLQRTLENGGTTLWTGTNITLNNAVITNRAGALFHAQNAATLMQQAGANRFDNAGTVRKSGNAGTTTFTSGVSLNNYNTVEIRSGILAASGGYTSQSNSLLNCAIGGTAAGTGFGQLQVAGTVNLNGSLSVDLINGFVPATNDSFTVLTAGTRTGTFANFFYPSNTVTMQLSYTANSVIVRVTDVPTSIPKPLFLSSEILGTDLKLTWTSVSNITYRVEYNPDLNFLDASNWTVLPGDVPGISNTASKLDALTSSNRFYRVRVLP